MLHRRLQRLPDADHHRHAHLGHPARLAGSADPVGGLAGRALGSADFVPRLDLVVPEASRRLWSPDDPHLYDLEIELVDRSGTRVDRCQSYAGLRSVTIEGKEERTLTCAGKVVGERVRSQHP